MNKSRVSSIIDKIIPVLIFIFAAFSVISIAGTQISLGLLFLFSIIKCVLDREWYFKRTSLDGAFLCFTGAYFLSTIFSLDVAQSLGHFKNLLLILTLYLVAFNLRTREQIRLAANILVATATVMAFLGLLMTDIFGGNRVMAFQSITMTWGALSAIFIMITLSLCVFGERNKKRWLYFGAFIIQFVSLLFSYVRGSWMGAAAGILVLAVLKSKKLFFGAVALVLIAFLLAPEPVKERILSITDLSVNSTQVRITQWRNAIPIFKDHPITGVGWIDLLKVHQQYAPPGADLNYHAYQIGHFHNNYIMFLIYFGIIGFTAAVFLIIRLFQNTVRILNAIPDEDRFSSALILGVLAALTGFWVNGFFDWTFGDAEPVTLLWFAVGLSLAVSKVTTPSKKTK